MKRKRLQFTIDYWKDDGWYVGQLREVPGVMSQGATLKDLEKNIADAYELVLKENKSRSYHPPARSKSIPICIPA